MRTELTENHLLHIFEFVVARETIVQLDALGVRFSNKEDRVGVIVVSFLLVHKEFPGLE